MIGASQRRTDLPHGLAKADHVAMKILRTLVHLSDLHIGRDDRSLECARALVDNVVEAGIDHVVVSGDITHRGRKAELDLYLSLFEPIADRLTTVPGNHDRLGDDIAAELMDDRRVRVTRTHGTYLIAVDSTGEHNRRYSFAGHGSLDADDLQQLDAALDAAPPTDLVVVTMHHHPVPLPEESTAERLATFFGLPYAAELPLGPELLRCLRGRCDLLLHGHRHVPRSLQMFEHTERPLQLFNAGSSTGMGRARVFTHGAGSLASDPFWLHADGHAALPVMPMMPAAAAGLD